MIVRQTTRLEASADKVWHKMQRISTFYYVTRGAMGYQVAEPPGEFFVVGQTVRGRVWLAHIVPIWLHQLEVVRVDDARREIYSNESGGPFRVWHHRLFVEPETAASCRYTDELEFDAGWLSESIRILALS